MEPWRQAVRLERADAVDEAVALCDSALAANPRCAELWVTRGSLHSRLAERMSALSCFRKADGLEPERSATSHFIRAAGGAGFAVPHRAEVADLFDHYADDFENHVVGALGYRGHDALPRLLAEHAVGSSRGDVLDLGCGTGLCGPGLRPLAGRLLGADIAPRIVAEARKRPEYDEVWVADAVYALYCCEPGTLAAVASADALGYIGPLDAVHEEACRALRPGGYFAYSVEAMPGRGPGYAMDASTRRCTYREAYLRDMARTYRLGVVALEKRTMRVEAGKPVAEHLVVLMRS